MAKEMTREKHRLTWLTKTFVADPRFDIDEEPPYLEVSPSPRLFSQAMPSSWDRLSSCTVRRVSSIVFPVVICVDGIAYVNVESSESRRRAERDRRDEFILSKGAGPRRASWVRGVLVQLGCPSNVD